MSDAKRPTAMELLEWGDLDARRRRSARGLAGLLSSPLVISIALSAVIALDLYRRMHTIDGNIGPIGFALAAIAFPAILVVFSTPYRMFWRHDSALLARLAIDGGALFSVAMARTSRAAFVAVLPGLVASLVVGLYLSADIGARLAMLALASAALSSMLAPAACLLGGAIVASDRAQAAIDALAGDAKPPGVMWLGSLPGFVAMAIALLAIFGRHWVALAEPFVSESLVSLGVASVASVAALLWARAAAPRILIDAQREVAGLDQVRLAHIDRSLPSPIERLWAALTCHSKTAKLIFDKDASLLRRRYPAPYFVAFLGVALTWIFAWSEQGTAVVVLLCSLSVYSIVMARRQAIAPVEIPRLLRSLPISESGARTAKRSAAALRVLIWVALPAAALLVFADNRGAAWPVPAFAVGFALIAGIYFSAETERP